MWGNSFRANFMWILGVWVMLFPSISEGSDTNEKAASVMKQYAQTGSEKQEAVGVISVYFRESERLSGEKYRNRVVAWLNHEKSEVIKHGTLEERLRRRQVAPPEASVGAKFEDIEAVVTQGTEDFYYKGNDAAIEVLQPVFERGIKHMEVTVRNPVYVEQVFQAGLMLIRAHSAASDPLVASEVARKLAVYFPGKEPSLSLVPPDVVEIWRAEVAKLASMGTHVVLEHMGEDQCEARINGVPAGANPMGVAADVDYMVAFDCGQASVPLWRVQVNAGEQAHVPLVSAELLKVSSTASDKSLRQREVEFGLKALSYWADIGIVLGVFADGDERGVVRLDRQKSGKGELAVQTVLDQGVGADADGSFDAMMLAIFPAVALARAEKAQAERLVADADPWISDWLTPTLFTTGVAVAAVGGVFLYDATARAKIMNCSPNAATQMAAGECKGIEEVEFTDSKKYYEEWDRVDRAKVIGYSGIGVGVALVGWGAWRLVSNSGSTESETVTEVDLWGGKASVGASARWRF